MSRVVGFSLQFKGSNDTLSEIERVEKSLKSVADQINAINKQNGGVVKPLTAGQGDFKKALNETNQILDQQTKLLKELAKAKPVDKTVIDGLNEKLKGFKKEIQDLKKELEAIKSPKIKIEKPEGFENAKGAITNILKELQGFSPAFDKVAEGAGLKFQNRISEIDKKIKIVKDGITSAKGSGASDDQINQLIKAERLLKAEKGELTKQINAEAKAFTDLSKTIDPTSLVGMRFELVKLKNEYSLLSEAQRSAQKGQELFNKIVNTNINISNLEQAQGDFRRNVGNYQNAITSIIPILDELKNKGKLTGASLVEAFKAESFANVERLQKEVTDLANDYDRLNKEQREMAEGQAIFAKLTSKAHELEGAMRSLPKETDSFKQKFIGLGDLVTGGLITGGILAAAGAVKAFGASAIQEFTQAETAIAKIEAQLAATGNTAGKTSEQLRGLAQDIEVSSGIAASTVLDQVTSKLLTFKNVQGEVFDAAQKAAINLAQVMGGDLAGAASLIGKALEDPEKGFARLAKAGVILSDASKKQVQEALKSNDAYKAQSIILKEIEGRVGGVADAINNSQLSGIRRLTVEWNNFKENIGGILITISNQFIKFYDDINDNVLFDTEGTKLATRAVNDLTKAITKEEISIKASFDALKKHNLTSKERGIIIDDVIKKYGDIISKEELEISTIEDLDRIQKTLTQTVKLQAFERVKAAAQEAAFTEIANKKIELAFAKRRDVTDLNLVQQLLASFASKDQIKEFFDQREKELEDSVKDLEAKAGELGKTLTDAFPELNVGKIQKTYEDANLAIKGVITKIYRELADKTLDQNIRNKLEDINNSFLTIEVDGRASQEYIDSVIKRAKDINATIDDLTKKSTTNILKNEEDLNQAAEKARQSSEEQRKRILELRNKIKDLNAESITNEFDQRIEQVKIKAVRDVEEIQAALNKIKAKKLLTPSDTKEIELSEQVIEKIGNASNVEIKKINDERARVLREAKDELIKIRNEVEQTVKETSSLTIDSNLRDLGFELDQQERNIKIQYDVDIAGLNEQLASGTISLKEYQKSVETLDSQTLNKQIEVNERYRKSSEALYDSLYDSQIKLNKAKYNGILHDIELLRLEKQRELIEKLRTGKISINDFIALGFANEKKSEADALSAKKDFIDKEKELDQERIKNKQEVVDKVLELKKKESEANNNKKQGLSDAEKENLKALLSASIEIAQETSNALFEIRNNQSDKEFENLSNNLEKERQARLKLVKGNAADEERINREFDAKKKQLDKEAFERQKRQSISQALINGALAATQSLAFTTVPFPASLLNLIPIAVSTALQIAKIKSQSFAEGGFGNKFIRKSGEGGYTGGSAAPPDHTGKRPVGYALFHANEYTSPEEQVGANKDLFDALEMDRKKKTWSGSHSEVNKLLRKKAFEALMYQEKTPNIFRQKIDIPIPQLYTVNYFNKNAHSAKVEFTDDMIERLADKIATKAEAAIEKGVGKGYKKAVKDLTIDETRKTLQELKRAI